MTSRRVWLSVLAAALAVVGVIALGACARSSQQVPARSTRLDSLAATGPGPRQSPPSTDIGPEGGTKEWLEFIGAEPATSPVDAAKALPFKIRIPETLAGIKRSALYVKTVPRQGPEGRPDEQLPATTHEVYLLFDDMGFAQIEKVPSDTDPKEWARGWDGTTGAETYLVHLNVNGHEAVGWNAGSHTITNADGTKSIVGSEGSAVIWLQDGVTCSITSRARTYQQMLPFAEAVSKLAPTN